LPAGARYDADRSSAHRPRQAEVGIVFLRGLKKGKFTDVEGYNRISRLIEDRQREVTGTVEEEPFDEESVLLSREPAGRDRAGVRTSDDRQVSTQPTAAPSSAAGVSEDRRIPFQPGGAEPLQPASASTGTPGQMETQQMAIIPPPAPIAEPPAIRAPETPKMVAPDLGPASMQGSLVAADAVWEGKLATNGNLRVEGTVHGEVQTGATLFVATNAHIDGTIQARSILLAGEIEGQIRVGERLEILPGGSARGEIETGTLVVHEGAFIDSRFQMRQPETPARR
ncbi:MAG: bactofilin family protein, partial [Dehalococcoidia bacterium]